jgi:uncharacterized protein
MKHSAERLPGDVSTRSSAGRTDALPDAARVPRAIPANASVDQLCPNCGLCCDGTLFADVKLRAGDDATRLRRLGLTLEKKGQRKLAFAQPCVCFDGTFCRIYGDRPKHCRLFECGLLKRVEAKEMSADAALKRISEARQCAGKVRALLRLLGQRDERLPLMHRYAVAMRAPVDLAAVASAKRHGRLLLAMNDLMNRLQRDFLG